MNEREYLITEKQAREELTAKYTTQLCEYCNKELEGEELDYIICRECYYDEMRDTTQDWNQR